MISPNMGAGFGEAAAQLYRDAELRILEKLTAAIASGITDPEWESKALGRVQVLRNEVIAELNRTNPVLARQILADLREAYGIGGLSVFEDVGSTLDISEAPAASERAAISTLLTSTTAAIDSAAPSILRAVDDVFREVVADAIGSTLTGAEFRKEAAQRALNRLVGQGLTTVPIGGNRNMKLPDYVSMAVRTGTASAAFQGHVDTQVANGFDLVIITPGPRACKDCDRWAREILAASGPAGTRRMDTLVNGSSAVITLRVRFTLDDARAAKWGHPNCRCGMKTYLPGITRSDEIKRPPWDEKGYQAQQQQRNIERQIREAKITRSIAITPQAAADADARVKAGQARMREHLDKFPELKRQSRREQAGRVF